MAGYSGAHEKEHGSSSLNSKMPLNFLEGPMKESMGNVMQSRCFGVLIGGLLGVCMLALTALPAWAHPPHEQDPRVGWGPKVGWAPRFFAPVLAAGQSKTFVVSFSSRVDLEQVELRVGPKLAPFIYAQPSAIPAIKSGQPVEIRLTVTVPITTPPGILHGVIQVRAVQLGEKKIKHQHMTPLPLPVALIVEKPVSSGLSDLTVFTNPGFPLMLGFTTLPDGNRVEVFGTRDSAGNPVGPFYLAVTLPDGKVTWIFLDEKFRVVRSVSEDGIVIKLMWVTDTQVVLSTVTPDGQAQASVSVDLTSAGVTNTNTGVVDLTGIDLSQEAIPLTAQQPRVQAQTSASLAPTAGQGNVTVKVSQCGQLTDADDILLRINSDRYAIQYPPTRVSVGTYAGTFATDPAAISQDSIQSVCKTIMSDIWVHSVL